jgi:hypothetical protein
MVGRRLTEFFFPVVSDRWITIFRVGLGLQVVFYCSSLWPDWNFLFVGNGNGLISRDLTETILTLDSPFLPRLGWLVRFGAQARLSESGTLSLTLACFFASGCSLIVGFLCRPSAIAAWFLHLASVTSGGFMAYGVDNFMTIGLFYLMLSPLPDRCSLDARLWKRRPKDPGRLGFHQRVLQLHLCLIYFFGGLDKCLGSGWWNGTSMWRALTRPPFNTIPPHILIRWSYLLPVVGIFICLIEIGYPVFIWSKATRPIWFLSVVGMHLAIALTMRMYLFALIMIVLNAAAFGPTLSREHDLLASVRKRVAVTR